MNNILFDSQKEIADILNAHPDLSAVQFLAENLKDIEFLITKALKTQGVCGIVTTPNAVFLGTSYGKDIVYELPDLTIMITENTPVARSKKDYKTSEDIAVRVADVLGSPSSKHFGTFQLIDILNGEDSGLVVSKVRFRCLVQGDLSAIEDPRDPTKTIPFALKTDLSAYYTKEQIDSKGYITEHQSLSNYYTKTLSDNRTSSIIEGYLKEEKTLSSGHFDVVPLGISIEHNEYGYYPTQDGYGIGIYKPFSNIITWEYETEAAYAITAVWIPDKTISDVYARQDDLSAYATKEYVDKRLGDVDALLQRITG